MKTPISLASRSVTVLDDGPARFTTQQLIGGDGGDAQGLSQVFETAAHPIEVALVPPAVRARMAHPGRRPTTRSSDVGTVQATDVVNAELDVSYVAECPEALLRALLEGAERAGCAVESITSADYAWAEAARMSADTVRSVVALQLEDAGEIRIIAARSGQPTFWRRLPLGADLSEIVAALGSAADQLGGTRSDLPILALGDTEFRRRIAEAAKTAHLTALVETARLQELSYDPAAVAAAFAGTGPRFVPPEVVRGARARTRRRGLLAAAAAVVCIGLAGFLDILDLRSEIDRVRAARQDVAAKVQSAMTERDHVTDLTTTLAGLESRRSTSPRWTAILGAVADATPRDAHVRALTGLCISNATPESKKGKGCAVDAGAELGGGAADLL